MMVVRQSEPGDLESLMALAALAGPGLTTLPRSEDVLSEHLSDSQRAFKKTVTRPRGERYLLVMEDLMSGDIVGCAGLVGCVGGFDPHYSYALRTVVKQSEGVGVVKEIRTLNLVEDHKGPSEIGTLFVHPGHRGGGNGRLLSLSRFALMAACPQRFTTDVIAEMRGNVDPEKGSPFWQAVGQHFFEMDFVDADQRSAANKQFIADLMPVHPLYIPMLPQEAQAAVGAVHPEAQPALKLLQDEGFVFGHEVDIFDAGPLYRASIQEIRTVAQSQVRPLSSVVSSEPDGPQYLVSRDTVCMRACLGGVHLNDDHSVTLSRACALALQLRIGDPVRFVSARP